MGLKQINVLTLLCILTFSYSCKKEQNAPVESSQEMFSTEKNVFGRPLKLCGLDPMTGYYRNGFCESREDDLGVHSVCVEVTRAFLNFTKNRGNDLTSPGKSSNFPGLKPGDRWCVCASWWQEADKAGKSPRIVLEASQERTLSIVDRERLEKFGLNPQYY